MNLAKQALAVGFGLFLLWGCGSNSSGTGGSANLVFISSTLARTAARTGTACSVTPDSTPVAGLCYTPTKVSGVFSQVSLSKTGGGTPARLLGGGSEVGFANIYKSGAFDLKTSPAIASSDDNLQDSTGPYNLLSVTIQALEVEFTAEATAKVYRVRIPFASTPPSATTVNATCLSASEKTEADKYGKLFGDTVAQAGDILVCIKNAVTDTCTDAEYLWVDNTGATFATRPATPLKVSGTYLITADACTAGASRPDITWGHSSLDLSLATAVDVTAKSGATKTYTAGSTSGTKLTATIDITSTNSLFVPTTALNADLSTFTQAQILAKIDNVLLKPLFIKKTKTTSAPANEEGMSAAVTLKIE